MKISSPHLPNDLLEGFIKGLFPEDACFQVTHIEMTSKEVTLVGTSTQPEGCCPLCSEPASRVHSRYERMLQDLPWSGKRVRLSLHVRRFFCANPCCPRQIFAERLPALTEAQARRTSRLRDALLDIGWALGGEAGALYWLLGKSVLLIRQEIVEEKCIAFSSLGRWQRKRTDTAIFDAPFSNGYPK
jgi:zinc-finger of transposase IS204/IS1001/IS1096/IS1165